MVFGDWSQEACCLLVYLRWEREDGHVECQLVTSKRNVTQRVKITMPRIELHTGVAAVITMRLLWRARESLKMFIGRTRYLRESSAM
jgi:hypothetical protein